MTFSGFWKAKIAIRIILFRVQVDDQLLLDVLRNVSPLGEVEESASASVGVPLEPRVARSAVSSEGVGDDLERLALLADANNLTGLNTIRRDVDNLSVDDDVLVANELASSCAGGGDAETVNYVIKTALKDGEEDLTGDTLGALSVGVSDTELTLEEAVGVLSLLLLLELKTVLGDLAAAVLTMLSGRDELTLLEILVGTKDGLTETASDPGFRADVLCHLIFDFMILISNDEYGSH